MTLADKFKGALNRVVAAFDRLKKDWMLIGAIPVAAWGRPRATTDLDFMVGIDLVDASLLDGELAGQGFTKIAGPSQIPQKPLVVSKYWFGPEPEKAGIGIDVFLASGAWQSQSIGRRVKVAFDRDSYWVATAEDLLLYKVLAGRVRDINDVEGILERRYRDLDWPYVWRSAGEIGLGLQPQFVRLLDQYLRERGLPGPAPWEK